ncbi:unnamed protein product [Sphagnum jensenii]|uniref:Pectinesterase n=1 Tax=Sphagnum jensenii TaxID=128206 RepID=A0ABP1BM47_9BRYO
MKKRQLLKTNIFVNLCTFILLTLLAYTSHGATADKSFGAWFAYINKTWGDLPDLTGPSVQQLDTHPQKKNQEVIIIVVSTDGSGNFTTIQAAIDSIPFRNKQPVEINIKEGFYREKILIPKTKNHITMIGITDNDETVIAWNSTASDVIYGGQKLQTINSATVAVEADYFIARNITFMNTAQAPRPGAVGGQAVALRISGDKAAFYGCRFLGHQDTLYDHKGRHFFKNCYIEGTVDFVFGNGRSFYEDVELHSDPNYGIPGSITAQKRDEMTIETGFVFVRCKIRGAGMVYLGRAWGNDSRVVFANTFMDKIVMPKGWDDWHIPACDKTVYYAQFNCTGEGASTMGRVEWARELTPEEAAPFITTKFINGESWLEKLPISSTWPSPLIP